MVSADPTRLAPSQARPERWLQFLHECAGGDAGMVRLLLSVVRFFWTVEGLI
jgi:hypothetical protein